MCAFLLRLLNENYKTKFVISDQHSNITSCVLPKWLPTQIVRLMVLEFGGRLREELGKLQKKNGTISELRGRARTSDTGRMSLDSIRSLKYEGPGTVEEYTATAFASHHDAH